MNASLVITSVAAPNTAMRAFAKGCLQKGIEFIVIGDAKSPADFFIESCRFCSLTEQLKLPYKLTDLLPANHYSRKNIGYLLSKNKQLIIETDDDNFPKDNFWEAIALNNQRVKMLDHKGWINIYRFFTKEFIWPRGFPIEELTVNPDLLPLTTADANRIKIIQYLADDNPDVDAVYRMKSEPSIIFDKDKKIALGRGTWCPFNSQNTVWHKEAFPLMYLPSYCSFRMTDIWRSFIAQRIAWQCGWNILFCSPTVKQERNEHNLLKDFEDEIPGYLNNDRIRKSLEDLDLKEGTDNMIENLIRCYRLMTENKWIGSEEMQLLDAWCYDLMN